MHNDRKGPGEYFWVVKMFCILLGMPVYMGVLPVKIHRHGRLRYVNLSVSVSIKYSKERKKILCGLLIAIKIKPTSSFLDW